LFDADDWRRVHGILRLSPREQQIIKCIFDGVRTEALIAAQLQMKKRTVHEHITRLYSKLDAATRSELMSRVFAAYLSGVRRRECQNL
jgi:DNA-binding CsgD family transcriptional regulator